MVTEQPRHIAGLDAIRLVCAAIVAAGHLTYNWTPVLEPIAGARIAHLANSALGIAFNGPAAVIVFFVLSGFVIHYPNIAKDRLNIPQFYARRFLRIVPPALVFVAIYLLRNPPPDTWNHTVLWSLICEAAYYALYPAFRWFGIGRALAISIALAVGFMVLNPPDDGQYVTYGAWTWLIGLPVWLGGCFVAANLHRLPALSGAAIWAWRAGIYGTSAVLLAAMFHADAYYSVTLSLFAVPVALWIGLEIRIPKSEGIADRLGKASYSLYLVHPLVIGPLTASPIAFAVAVSAATAAFYFAVERPSHLLARSAGKRLGGVVFPPVAAVT